MFSDNFVVVDCNPVVDGNFAIQVILAFDSFVEVVVVVGQAD